MLGVNWLTGSGRNWPRCCSVRLPSVPRSHQSPPHRFLFDSTFGPELVQARRSMSSMRSKATRSAWVCVLSVSETPCRTSVSAFRSALLWDISQTPQVINPICNNLTKRLRASTVVRGSCSNIALSGGGSVMDGYGRPLEGFIYSNSAATLYSYPSQ